MPNRILREGILRSKRVNVLSWQAEVFYRRLMSVVDDFGRYEGDLSLLLAYCFPLRTDSVTREDIQHWLDECKTALLVWPYDVGSERFLEVLDFRQQTRAKKSRCPEMPEDAKQVLSKCLADAKRLQSNAHLYGDGDVYGDGDGAPVESEYVAFGEVQMIPPDFSRQKHAYLTETHGWIKNHRLIDWKRNLVRMWQDYGHDWQAKRRQQKPSGSEIAV